MDDRNLLARWLFYPIIYQMLCLLPWSSSTGSCWSQLSTSPVTWKTGADLDRELERPITVTWGGATLRSELTKFANSRGIGIFIDRRIDPNSPINIQIRDRTFEQILWSIADQNDWSACRLNDLFYLGPPGVAIPLLSLWQQQQDQVRHSPARFHKFGTKTESINWPFLSRPARLLIDLTERHQFQIAPLPEQVQPGSEIDWPLPHDLWPSIQLPPLTVDEQVALMLVGFGLWYDVPAMKDTIELIPFPNPAFTQIAFVPLGNQELMLRELRAGFPDCTIRRERNRFVIQGAVARLAEINRRLVESTSAAAAAQQKVDGTAVFTLTTRASRKDLLMAIANNQGLQLQLSSEFQADLEQAIELQVEKVTFEELLSEVLKGSQLKYKVNDGKLEIIR